MKPLTFSYITPGRAPRATHGDRTSHGAGHESGARHGAERSARRSTRLEGKTTGAAGHTQGTRAPHGTHKVVRAHRALRGARDAWAEQGVSGRARRGTCAPHGTGWRQSARPHSDLQYGCRTDVHGSELKVLASVHRRLLGRRLGLGSRRVALRGKEAATGVSATPTTLSMARFEQGTCVGVCVFGRACAA